MDTAGRQFEPGFAALHDRRASVEARLDVGVLRHIGSTALGMLGPGATEGRPQ